MIKSFKHNGLEQFWTDGVTRRLPVSGAARFARLRTQLVHLNGAVQPSDMNLPGWRWHPLGDMRPGFYSVTVTGNYRLTYRWEAGNALDLNIEDYH